MADLICGMEQSFYTIDTVGAPESKSRGEWYDNRLAVSSNLRTDLKVDPYIKPGVCPKIRW